MASEMDQLFPSKSNTIKEESLSALVNLGFAKKSVEKVLEHVLKGGNDQITVEELIKEALKKL
jgi:Holliday junction DNA helicase RuvA